MQDLTPELLALSSRADAVLARVLPPEDQPPVELHRAMRYAVLGDRAQALCAQLGARIVWRQEPSDPALPDD